MNRPLAYCTEPHCTTRVVRGRCPLHARQQEATRRRADNPVVLRWYRSERWQRLRRAVLAAAAYTCQACRTVRVRLDVDHVVPHHGNPTLFWNRANLQALCHDCHTQKTNRGE